MNETGLIEADTSTSKLRQADDDALAAEVVRYASVRAWRVCAGQAFAALGLNFALSWLAFDLGYLWVTAYSLVAVPPVVGLFLWARGVAQEHRLRAHLASLPLWERHRINLVLSRIADRKE
jgi:hypothetical protein